MSRLKSLLRTAPDDTGITQQDVQPVQVVAQHLHIAQQVLLHVVRPSLCKTQQTVSDANPAAQVRRQRALAMLADNPALRLAVVCDSAGDPVKLAVAIRDKGSVEVLIPAARFDPFALLALIDKHTASETLH